MKSLRIIKKTPGLWHAEPDAGCHINTVCKDAIQVASDAKVKVTFIFNDIEIIAADGDLPEQLATNYSNESDRRAHEWRESDAGKKYEAEQHQRLIELQVKIDGMLAEFDEVSGLQPKLIEWVGRFAELNDHIKLNFDKLALAAKMEAAGYEESAEVGQNPEAIRIDKTKMARYIIGQAINHLRSGMPIHPMCSQFAAEYRREAPAVDRSLSEWHSR